MAPWSRSVLLSLLPLVLVMVSEAATLTYQLDEEHEKGTVVGNIERDMLTRGELASQDAFNLRYSLSSGDKKDGALLFSVEETSSVMTTAGRIDRETVCPGEVDCEIKLRIFVYKLGNSLDLFKMWSVVVSINDINDNAPTFSSPYVSLSVPESVSPPLVLHFSGAEDKDVGNNSVEEYRLTPPSPLFDLSIGQNPDGSADLGLVIKQQLDREVTELYLLTVTATDGGSPQRTGSLTINITVTDLNDNRPRFFRGIYNITLTENVFPGDAILQVSATDDDKGINGDIAYQFSSGATDDVRYHLQIDVHSGIISVFTPFDYEEKRHYQFNVVAQDGGSPRLTGTTLVILNIQDANDNAPRITINLTPSGNNLPEYEALGTLVARVSVTDFDSGGNSLVVCRTHSEHFSLQVNDSHAGNLYNVVLSRRLDFERDTTHLVTITCQDAGNPPLTATASFTVHVRDANDNAPVFTQSTYTGVVMENQPESNVLLTVSAVDADSGPAGTVEYSLEDNSISRLFTLDPVTGELRTRVPLTTSMEEDHRYHPKGYAYRFHVLAFDLGTPRFTSTASVIITVEG